MVGVIRHPRPCTYRTADGKRVSILDLVNLVPNALPLKAVE